MPSRQSHGVNFLGDLILKSPTAAGKAGMTAAAIAHRKKLASPNGPQPMATYMIARMLKYTKASAAAHKSHRIGPS